MKLQNRWSDESAWANGWSRITDEKRSFEKILPSVGRVATEVGKAAARPATHVPMRSLVEEWQDWRARGGSGPFPASWSARLTAAGISVLSWDHPYKRAGLDLATTTFAAAWKLRGRVSPSERRKNREKCQRVANVAQLVGNAFARLGYQRFDVRMVTNAELEAMQAEGVLVAISEVLPVELPMAGGAYALIEIGYPSGEAVDIKGVFLPSDDQPGGQSRVLISSEELGGGFLRNVLAHELFHSIQFETGFSREVGHEPGDDADVDVDAAHLMRFWVEGPATLMGYAIDQILTINPDDALDGAQFAELGNWLLHELFPLLVWDTTVPLWRTSGDDDLPYRTWKFFAAVDDGDVNYVLPFLTHAVERLQGGRADNVTDNDLVFDALRVELGRRNVAELYAVALRNAGRQDGRPPGSPYLLRTMTRALSADRRRGVAFKRASNGSVLLLCLEPTYALAPAFGPEIGVVLPPLNFLEPMAGQSIRVYFAGTQRVEVTLDLGFGETGSRGMDMDRDVVDPGQGRSDLFVAVQCAGEDGQPVEDLTWVYDRPPARGRKEFRTIRDDAAFDDPVPADTSYITIDIMNIETMIFPAPQPDVDGDGAVDPDYAERMRLWQPRDYRILIRRVD